MNTNLPAIQDALHAAIVAQNPGCRVSLGYPLLGTRDEDLWVDIDGDVDVVEEWSGGCSRKEAQTVHVKLLIEKMGGTPKNTRDRAFALFASVEAALAADRTLGGRCEYASVKQITPAVAYEDELIKYGIDATVAIRTTVA